jgi:FkbM family methyltransferase
VKEDNLDHPVPRLLAEIVQDMAEIAFPGGGFFVEAGAHDGLTQSNTARLSAAKWSGLLVEPSPTAFRKLQENRPECILANVALVEKDNMLSLTGTFSEGSLMGSAHPDYRYRTPTLNATFFSKVAKKLRLAVGLKANIITIEVRAKTLDRLVQDHAIESIDILVLDIEGLELEALRGFGFRPRPRVIIIETRYELAAEINNLMLSKDYVLARNFSNFSKQVSPQFTEDLQDYVWIPNDDYATLAAVLAVEMFV